MPNGLPRACSKWISSPATPAAQAIPANSLASAQLLGMSKLDIAWSSSKWRHDNHYKHPTLHRRHKEGMRNSEGQLAQYADRVSRELCEYLENKSRGIYNTVQFIAPDEHPQVAEPNLFLHRSEPAVWDDVVIFTIFLVDVGDLAYEPRLQAIENLLRDRSEVQKISRANAPNSMVKDMVSAEIVLKERRKEPRSAQVEGGQAKLR